MSQLDVSYYRQRAVTERAMAASSNRADVAEIHVELARLYQALADQQELRPERTLAFSAPQTASA